jgi:hypothetical protein
MEAASNPTIGLLIPERMEGWPGSNNFGELWAHRHALCLLALVPPLPEPQQIFVGNLQTSFPKSPICLQPTNKYRMR